MDQQQDGRRRRRPRLPQSQHHGGGPRHPPRGALADAQDRFTKNREAHERRVNVRDGRRADGRSTGSAFGELKELSYGEASYSQTSIGRTGLHAVVYVRQGPWLIEVGYGGDNRSGAKYPGGDETRAAAGKIAALVTAEMAKDAAKVKDAGPCGGLRIEAAFFPEAEGPSIRTDDGRIKSTACTWAIRAAVEHEPGQEFTARGGELTIRVVDWGGGSSGSAFQFDRDAKKYDRYRAKGGIGSDRYHTAYEPRQALGGLGQRAFAVVSGTSALYDKSEPPRKELLIEILDGDRTIEVTFRGTTTGGGLLDDPGYRAPEFDASFAREAMTKVAGDFLKRLH